MVLSWGVLVPVSESLSGAVAQFVVSQFSSPDDCFSSAEGSDPPLVVPRPVAWLTDAPVQQSLCPPHLWTGPSVQALSPIILPKNVSNYQFTKCVQRRHEKQNYPCSFEIKKVLWDTRNVKDLHKPSNIFRKLSKKIVSFRNCHTVHITTMTGHVYILLTVYSNCFLF